MPSKWNFYRVEDEIGSEDAFDGKVYGQLPNFIVAQGQVRSFFQRLFPRHFCRRLAHAILNLRMKVNVFTADLILWVGR